MGQHGGVALAGAAQCNSTWPRGRGGGIDVCFSAPKSVSAVWAIGDPWQREQIETAHGIAVARTLEHLRERVPMIRRRYGERVVEEAGEGFAGGGVPAYDRQGRDRC